LTDESVSMPEVHGEAFAHRPQVAKHGFATMIAMLV
jgi:hypothetical protein